MAGMRPCSISACRSATSSWVRPTANAGTISIRESKDSRISHCLVRNYMRVSVDDRTKPDDTGYAFNCTDGTGIGMLGLDERTTYTAKVAGRHLISVVGDGVSSGYRIRVTEG